jgi:hypothetical protein
MREIEGRRDRYGLLEIATARERTGPEWPEERRLDGARWLKVNARERVVLPVLTAVLT